jgi:hypothetical protein
MPLLVKPKDKVQARRRSVTIYYFVVDIMLQYHQGIPASEPRLGGDAIRFE